MFGLSATQTAIALGWLLTIAATCRSQVPMSRTPMAFPPDSAILALIRQRVIDKRSTGIVVGLLEPNGRTRIIAFGDPGPGKPPLDGNSVFEIGSITKTFTATILADMVQRGRVSLDDPAQRYLPSEVKLPTRNGKAITLGNLTSQNSGLPRLPSNLRPKDAANPYADYTAAQMYEFLSGYQLTRDPGAQYEYSNLGVGLLGHILALREGMPYEQLVTERVLRPLGMTHTSITLTPWMSERLAPGHHASGRVTANWDLPTLAGAGALRSTALDMLTYVEANVHPERGSLERAMATAHQLRGPSLPGAFIGMNWIINRWDRDTIIQHDGGTGGYVSFVGFIESKRVGVVVLSNSSVEGVHDIGMHLLEPELPLVPRPAPAVVRTAIELSAEALAKYTGLYQVTPAFTIDVTLSGGVLHAKATGQTAFRLWPETASDFFIKELDAQVTFVRDAAGQVTGLVLHQGGANTAAKRMPGAELVAPVSPREAVSRSAMPTGTLIASNMNDHIATLIDAGSGRVLATLQTGEGPHEVTVSHDGRWAVVSNYGVRGRPGNSLTVIDVARREVARTLDLHDRQRPHGVKFLPGDSVLVVTSEASGAVLLVDVVTGVVLAARPTGGRASHMVALSANGDRMIMGNIADGTISVLRPRSSDSAKVIRVAAQPEGIAISPDGSMAWVGSNKDSVVVVVNLSTGQQVDSLRGFGMPYRIAVSPDGQRVVVTDPVKAQVRVFDAMTRHERFLIPFAADSLVATAEIKGSASPEGVAISNDSRWAFVTLQGRNRVATIDLERGAVVGLAPTGNWSDGIGYSALVPRQEEWVQHGCRVTASAPVLRTADSREGALRRARGQG